MKKIIIFLFLFILLTGCGVNNSSVLTGCKKNGIISNTESDQIPDFTQVKKLKYTYIIDGREYSDHLITSDEVYAFDFLKFIDILGVENNGTADNIKLSYLSEDMELIPDDNGFFIIYYKEKKLDFGINPYKKDNKIYVSEQEILNIKDSKKLPLNIQIDESTKTVAVTNPLFSSDEETVKYFDLVDYNGNKAMLFYQKPTMTIQIGERSYEKEVSGNYISGRIVIDENKTSDFTVYLWDGNEAKSIPLKIGS